MPSSCKAKNAAASNSSSGIDDAAVVAVNGTGVGVVCAADAVVSLAFVTAGGSAMVLWDMGAADELVVGCGGA